MIRINLLPFRVTRKRENIRQQVSIFLLSFLLLLTILGWHHLQLGEKRDDLKTQIAEAEKRLEEYNKTNAEIAEIRKELDDLTRKIEVISTLQLDRAGPVRLLDAMTEIVVPKRMWFTSLEEKAASGSAEEGAKTITIRGVAQDNTTVADFMTRLEGSPLFSSVHLIRTKRDKQGSDSKRKSFHIDCEKALPKTTANSEEGNNTGQK